MNLCLLIIGALGFFTNRGSSVSWAIGSILVVMTLINMVTVGPVCYTIVGETPSGPLRAKTIAIGRTVYNLTGLVTNTITPRMLSPSAWNWGARGALLYAGTNLACLVWCIFRLPETKGRTFAEIEILFERGVSARRFKSTNVEGKRLDLRTFLYHRG